MGATSMDMYATSSRYSWACLNNFYQPNGHNMNEGNFSSFSFQKKKLHVLHPLNLKLANGADTDEIIQNVASHNGLHFLLYDIGLDKLTFHG